MLQWWEEPSLVLPFFAIFGHVSVWRSHTPSNTWRKENDNSYRRSVAHSSVSSVAHERVR